MEKATVIITSWNERDALKRCVQEVLEYNENIQLICIDNGSQDGTHQWLKEQGVDFIYFDEGVQEYGKVLNVVFENFEVEENIILLLPRYQIGKHAIHRMIQALQEDEKAGVVGLCAADLPYEQNLDLKTVDQLEQIEEERKEERNYIAVGSAGFCFAMKKSFIEKNGSFESSLASMDGVMIDYQLRAVQNGYRNKICRSACAYDWGERREQEKILLALKVCDKNVLKQKWKMNYFMMSANDRFVNMIERSCGDEFSVLEVGCDMGANLLGIKNHFPNSRVYGLEINPYSSEIGENILKIRQGNIEEENVSFGEKFDYIIFGDVLEHLHNPQRTIQYCRTLLKENGRILASIPNIMHISVMQQLLRGEFCYTDMGLLDRTHIHFFTQKEIVKMFGSEKYEIEALSGIVYPLTEEEEKLKKKLLEISTDVSEDMYEIYQYTVVARKI